MRTYAFNLSTPHLITTTCKATTMYQFLIGIDEFIEFGEPYH